MKRFIHCLLISVFAITIFSGCATKSEADFPKDNGKINVAASFYTMQDFSSKIGGDKVNIITLAPSGVEPHDWEPKSRDIVRVKNADVLIYNGAGMENWVDQVINSAKNKELITVQTSKGLKLLAGTKNEEDNKKIKKEEIDVSVYDPHVWLNPQNAIKQLSVIKDAFVLADAKNKDYYEQNFKTYSEKFNQVDIKFKTEIAKFSKKDIIVAHAAFGYLCDAYGLNQVAIEGLNAESEPTAARMVEITKFAKENKVKVIFFEELVNPKVAKAIAKEVGVETDKLDPLEGLSAASIKEGKEYISVMLDNLESIKKALN